MRHLVRNICMVLALLVLLSAYIWPVSETVRQGKDLRGGFSLQYQVLIDPSQNAEEVMDTTITVLKDRIDPQGTLDLTIVPQGRDRIEITMPLPNDEVKALRAEYEAALEEIRSREITGREFDRMLAMEGEAQREEIDRLAGGSEKRRELMNRAVETLAREQEAAAELREQPEDAPPEYIDQLVERIATASNELDQIRDELVATVLKADDIAQALQLSDERKAILDDTAEEPYIMDSAREKAIASLKESHPEDLDTINEVIEKFERYRAERKTLDDPSDLVRLLQGSGVLEFRIAPGVGEILAEDELRQKLREDGPRMASTRDARWFPLADPTSWLNTIQQAQFMEGSPADFFRTRNFVVEEYDGVYYMLLWDTPGDTLTQSSSQSNWRVARAFETFDDQGRPAVGFRMDVNGGRLLGNLTENHVGEPMAVLLDNKVYTAPNLISKISSQGQITGIDSAAEREMIIRTLNAGTLTATLSPQPISDETLGPELGQDNLDAGLMAGIISLIVVSVFMIVYYFLAGLIAVIALLCNAILILGMIVLGNVTLTLPGIAGIILTFGMAVDANVLIFERIREERRNGLDLRPAIRLGYSKALSSIVDGNVTNLIVCLVLANIGTQEIKGFAITLGIGVIGTLFSALVISRLIFGLMTEKFGLRHMPQLPNVVPIIERTLEPKIDWLKYRVIFIIISICYVSLGIGMIFHQGSEMLDTEFRGGTAITLQFRDGADGQPLTMERPEVAERIFALGEAADENDESSLLTSAEVLPIDPEDDGVTSSRFRIKTLATNSERLQELIQTEFADVLPTKSVIRFAGDTSDDLRLTPVYPITEKRLGEVIDRPDITADVSAYDGGVAIVLDDIQPVTSREDLIDRLEYMRSDQQFSELLSREWDLIILEGDRNEVESAALVVIDEGLTVYQSKDRWDAEVAEREWNLVRQALTRTESLAGLSRFDAAVASSFRGKAVAAVTLSLLLITIYIWVRFGSVRYSLAALLALVHDVLTAIGLIALAEIIYTNPELGKIAAQLNILPFKIDLEMIAALLTIIGYSLNDTIIIMDRIRENRGKLEYASRRIVNLSINQTISRTVITSGTTLAAVLILYILGGEGVRAFSYALLVGILIGTYSSVAVAAPFVWSARHDREEKARIAAEGEEPSPVKDA